MLKTKKQLVLEKRAKKTEEFPFRFVLGLLAFQLGAYLLDFGLVFFLVALLLAIWRFTSTGERTGLSAYSVFNRNFERLRGEIDPDQIDKEIRRKLY